jgi:hypothetical protein
VNGIASGGSRYRCIECGEIGSYTDIVIHPPDLGSSYQIQYKQTGANKDCAFHNQELLLVYK